MADENPPRIEEGLRSGLVIVDAGVVRDIATALRGDWQPDDEPDPERRRQMVAAARLRIYTGGDTHGWHLVTTPAAHRYIEWFDGNTWGVGFIQDLSSLPDAPPLADVEALVKLQAESGLDGEAGDALAWAMLYEPVIHVVSRDPRAFRHSRPHDLPPRLELLDPVDAVDHLRLAPGEEPEVAPPSDVTPEGSERWWLV